MALIKRLVLVLLLLIVLIYGMVFSINNASLVQIDFLLNFKAEVPLALWSGVLLLLGVVVGLIFAQLASWPIKRENTRLQKSLAQAKDKLTKLELK